MFPHVVGGDEESGRTDAMTHELKRGLFREPGKERPGAALAGREQLFQRVEEQDGGPSGDPS